MTAGIAQGQMRANDSAAAEESRAEGDALTEPIEEETLPEERRVQWRTPGFHRMRTDWDAEDSIVMSQVHEAVDARILHNFASAYQVMFDVYDLVRTKETDDGGNVLTDRHGFPVWKRTVSGNFEEDWSALTLKQKENLLFSITTRLFEWEQAAGNAWTEAMFAKAKFEERFAIGFDAPTSGTVDSRKAHGTLESTEERYFAIFLSAYSRKADAVVRTLTLLGQRLKDSMS